MKGNVMCKEMCKQMCKEMCKKMCKELCKEGKRENLLNLSPKDVHKISNGWQSAVFTVKFF